MSKFFQWLKSFRIEGRGETLKNEEIPSIGLTESAENPIKKKKGFSSSYTLGNHLYRSYGEKVSIEFDNAERGIHKQIIDDGGRILRFPGIIQEEFWIKKINMGSLEPVVRYRSSFQTIENGNYRMLWQIQPDGRYWEDEDGFGAESDAEILLYADIDQNGDFLGPFKIYKLGIKQYLLEEKHGLA